MQTSRMINTQMEHKGTDIHIYSVDLGVTTAGRKK